MIRGSRLCVLSSGSFAHYDFQLYNINFDFLFALWTVEREFYQYCLFAHLGSRLTSANRAINPQRILFCLIHARFLHIKLAQRDRLAHVIGGLHIIMKQECIYRPEL